MIAISSASGFDDSASYRALLTTGTRLTTTAAAATTYLLTPGGLQTTSQAVNGTANTIGSFFYLAAADYSVAGKTAKLRVTATVITGTVAPAVTITTGLYPLATAANAISPGALVASSTAAVATPAVSTITRAASADIALPADGLYALGVVVSGIPSGDIQLAATLQLRYA